MSSEQLYPGVPDATDEDKSIQLSAAYRTAELENRPLLKRFIRRAATAERRVAELERRLEEAEKAADTIWRFEKTWTAWDNRKACAIFSGVHTADLARELGAWLDEQEGVSR